MIRIVFALFAFAVVLCSLIIYQTGGSQTRDIPVQVSRSVIDDAPLIAPAENLIIAPEPTQITARVEPVPAATTVPAQDAALRNLTQGVLAGLGQSAPPPIVTTDTELKIALIQAIGEGREPDYIRAILLQASDAPHLHVPLHLITARGIIDLEPYLAPPSAAAVDSVGVQTPTPINASGDRTYIVQPGDSLGSIAVQFYNDRSEYLRIFAANRRVLPTVDMIRPGQELIIPN